MPDIQHRFLIEKNEQTSKQTKIAPLHLSWILHFRRLSPVPPDLPLYDHDKIFNGNYVNTTTNIIVDSFMAG